MGRINSLRSLQAVYGHILPDDLRQAAAIRIMAASRNSQLLAGSASCHPASYVFPR